MNVPTGLQSSAMSLFLLRASMLLLDTFSVWFLLWVLSRLLR